MKIKPVSLRCEYVENPIGVQAEKPLLSFQGSRDLPGGMQSAYRIVAASEREKLLCGEYDLWDSGIVKSERSVGIEYGGKPLGSGERVWWRVQIFRSEEQHV